jgi:hypothetical protein
VAFQIPTHVDIDAEGGNFAATAAFSHAVLAIEHIAALAETSLGAWTEVSAVLSFTVAASRVARVAARLVLHVVTIALHRCKHHRVIPKYINTSVLIHVRQKVDDLHVTLMLHWSMQMRASDAALRHTVSS